MVFSMKQRKPHSFNGKRGKLSVKKFIYHVKQYTHLVEMSNRAEPKLEQMKALLVPTFISAPASNW